jgi:excisionase family DNA binding protein
MLSHERAATTTQTASTSSLRRRVYRAREVAEILGLPLQTVYEALRDGRIPARRIGRTWLISAAWVEGVAQ